MLWKKQRVFFFPFINSFHAMEKKQSFFMFHEKNCFFFSFINSFHAMEKTKSVLESQINLENSLWPFFKFDLVFPQMGRGKRENWIKFEFLFIVTSGKTCEETKSKFKNGQREFSKFIWLPKTLCFFS